MSGVSDAELEAALRDVLAATHAPTSAPADLRAKVERIPTFSRPGLLPTRFRIATTVAAGLAGLVTVAVIGFLLVSRAMNMPAVPYATPGAGSPASPTYEPSIVGPGIVTSVALLQGWVPWVLAGLGWIVLAAIAIRGWRRRRAVIAAAMAVAIGLGGGAFTLTTQPGLVFGHAAGPVFGLDVIGEPPRASNGPSVWYVTADKGEPFVFAMVLMNPGPFPVRYLGIYEPTEPFVHTYHWAAVWQVDDSHGGVPAPSDASSFHPIDVPPREFITLYVVARASDCVYGAGFRLEDADQFRFLSREWFDVVYSVAGLTSTSRVELPAVIAEPVLGNCPAT